MKKSFLIGCCLITLPLFGEVELGDIYNPTLAQVCQTELENHPEKFLTLVKNNIYTYLTKDLEKNIDNEVNYYWELYRIDETYERVVKEIIEQYKEKTSLWIKIKGNFSPDTAKKLGEEIAVKAFTDPRLQNKLTQLVQSVTNDAIERFKTKLTSLSDVLLANCLQDAVKGKIDPVLLKIFGSTLQEGTKKGVSQLQLEENSVDIQVPYIGVTGIALIAVAVRRQLMESLSKRLAARLTARIAGQVLKRVATRLIPIIGIILAAWDVKDIVTGDSLFNSLQEVLISPETEDTFRREIVKALKEEINETANYIASDLSKRLFVAVKSYVNQLVQYNQLLENDPLLRKEVDWLVQRGELDKAQKLLEFALFLKQNHLYDQITPFLVHPQKLEKLLDIYPFFLPVLQHTKSLEAVYKWYTLVGEDKKLFAKLVELELYKYLSPSSVSPDLVRYLLSFSEYSTVRLLVKTVPPQDIKKLEKIPPYQLEKFLKLFGVKGVKCLTFYAAIDPTLADKFAKETLKQEKLFYFLCRKKVKEYIKENPTSFNHIVEFYRESKNLLGKITIFVKTLKGEYPLPLVKILSPTIYYLTIFLWFLGIGALIGVFLKLLVSLRKFKRSKTQKRKPSYSAPVQEQREEKPSGGNSDSSHPQGGNSGIKKPSINGEDNSKDSPQGGRL